MTTIILTQYGQTDSITLVNVSIDKAIEALMKFQIKNNCINPGEAKSTDSESTKLAILEEKHRFIMCRIESMHRLLLDLNTEVSKTSTDAGIVLRNMIRMLENVSMCFITDARKEIKEQSNKVQAEVDARNKKIVKGYNILQDKEEASPGLEKDDRP